MGTGDMAKSQRAIAVFVMLWSALCWAVDEVQQLEGEQQLSTLKVSKYPDPNKMKDQAKSAVAAAQKGQKQFNKDSRKKQGAAIHKSTNKAMRNKFKTFVHTLAGPVEDLAKLRQASDEEASQLNQKHMNSDWKARKEYLKASEAHSKATAAMATIKAKNAEIRSSWKTLSTEAIDESACKPFPACLKQRAECKDTYESVTCIRARRGSNNLCKMSAKIQEMCCETCAMDNMALCKKEKKLLAGGGDEGPAPKMKIPSQDMDAECQEGGAGAAASPKPAL